VAELDARIKDIDAEQASLLQALADRKGKTVEAGTGRQSRGRTQPFKIRY
jgi:hypothetical protein